MSHVEASHGGLRVPIVEWTIASGMIGGRTALAIGRGTLPRRRFGHIYVSESGPLWPEYDDDPRAMPPAQLLPGWNGPLVDVADRQHLQVYRVVDCAPQASSGHPPEAQAYRVETALFSIHPQPPRR